MSRKNDLKFDKIKNVILFIWNYECYMCHQMSLSLHVHHIDSNSHNNSVYNLIPLCKNCHKLVHKNNAVLSIHCSNDVYLNLKTLNDYWCTLSNS